MRVLKYGEDILGCQFGQCYATAHGIMVIVEIMYANREIEKYYGYGEKNISQVHAVRAITGERLIIETGM